MELGLVSSSSVCSGSPEMSVGCFTSVYTQLNLPVTSLVRFSTSGFLNELPSISASPCSGSETLLSQSVCSPERAVG